MIIVLIDDDDLALASMCSTLSRLGQDVRPYSDPQVALRELDQDVDIVLADVTMPVLDGFRVALRATALLGNSPPKTVLISGTHWDERMASSSPSMVVGLLHKPVGLQKFQRLLGVLEESRESCPGLQPLFWRGPRSACPGVAGGGPQLGMPCDTPGYADCPHYETTCGRDLQDWIGDGCSEGNGHRHGGKTG
ncbi:MAG: response regulator transcription factor [Lentisphaerae bacterium]|nr:response regulator transcription factor [Lentisphaerota bacterium]